MYSLRCLLKINKSIKFRHCYTMSNEVKEENTNLTKDFSDFKFSACRLLDLPIEENRQNYVRSYIKGAIFSHVDPTPLSSPKMVCFSDSALTAILDLDPSVTESQEFIEFVTGNNILTSSTPLSHRYGGYQFGVWASQLGDGRAVLLGEYTNRKGERWELQLKGSGLTPYSRHGDGRAVLRSSIREFLCSEALYYLGIPTSRAGTVVVSEDKVVRDPMYDGNPQMEFAAVVLRLAKSWFRIGSLEILAKTGEMDLLKTLLNFILKEHFPEIPDDECKIINFLQKVFRTSSDLVVQWQSVGFTHGVLNTDNMSLLGITIDYGPFGFMEDYDALYVPNHSDVEARYCYSRQMQIVLLNMLMLTKAVSPLLRPEETEVVAKLLHTEAKYTQDKYFETFSLKLGFSEPQRELVELLIEMFEETKADLNMVFRELSENSFSSLTKPGSKQWGLQSLSKHEKYPQFLEDYRKKMDESGKSDAERMESMLLVNPCYVLRNWMAHQAILKAEKGDYSEVSTLLRVLKSPFTRQEEAEKLNYAGTPPTWAESLCLSCSS